MSWSLLLVTACGSTEALPSTNPVVTPPAPIGVVFERLLPPQWGPPKPLFGPDGSLTVGAARWSAAGARLPAHAFQRSGQLRPVAIAGTAATPRVIALGWGGLVEGVRDEPEAYLVTGELRATLGPRTSGLAIAHDFHADDDIALSPDRSAVVMVEHDQISIRDAASGAVRRHLAAREPGRVCWVDDREVAWISERTLHVGARTQELPAATSIVACDPGGRAAAIAVPGGIGVLELETGAVRAVVASASPTAIAIAQRGERLAIATADKIAVYRRTLARFEVVFSLAAGARHLAFSTDGHRLAITDRTLIVVGEGEVPPARPEVPRFRFELPPGFTADQPVEDSWHYAQLPAPRAGGVPALLVSASRPGTHVIGLALELAELPPIPPATASDRELAAFGKQTLARWFEAWAFATEDDDGYTIQVGRTDGLRWFEARELHRDGCEPFDGYTRVVLDRELAYVIRAVTVPGGSIAGWLDRFFSLPFTARVQTALRHGPRPGPC